MFVLEEVSCHTKGDNHNLYVHQTQTDAEVKKKSKKSEYIKRLQHKREQESRTLRNQGDHQDITFTV